MENAMLRAISIKLVSWLPGRVKIAFKNSPAWAFAARGILNFFLGLPNTASTVKINSGLLKGYRMSLNLRVEKSYWFGVWESRLQQLSRDLAQEGMVVYDVGAHIGFFSLLFSKCVGKAGKVFAFEPDKDIFERLTKNIKLNDIQNVILVNLAISDENGSALFDKTQIDSMGHLTSQRTDVKTIEVKTQTLDYFVYEEKNPAPNLVKIDVEGAEDKVLKGMQRLLGQARPAIICEIHTYEAAQEFFKALAPHRYELFKVGDGLSRIQDLKGYTGICHVLAKPY